ncbi:MULTISPECIES: DegT/DnrJ/EryC1/StrS family aminotransferase [Peribacillus]|uniref:DegT/DnrJ/EryC1/StrS family aminotransferase n=1 Tax=Peribacillus TaxID=2675229 RepID=UPI001F4EDBB8|nr:MULTISPECIES: aminotransferase class I/II-fold pyridoxal phosphate-dependent enzyme [unclassified Peribacillus]MCK1981259.1 aminotransferase class I/II-fold pyridoxal phosphate-dependent enzyme [Peribacillus sp. Aquil_B1]MCK2006994.1 aminotransferase class I/II-fold pyridoxal phosphate-dependent enzyme [Peribacillus sp. Aquil_B8]
MENKRLYLSPPHMSGNEQMYISQAFETNWIAPLGPNVKALEEEFAKYAGTKGALAVSSGTAAIHLALQVLGVTTGDTVFCSSLTFIASANPIIYQGAKPVFIDSESDTWNMSPKALELALEYARKNREIPKAVILVHLFGQSAKVDEIKSICGKYKVALIEDAAESLGGTYKGKQTGAFGDIGIYSFNGNKIITTSGGGMLVSNNEEYIHKALFLSTQARDQALHYQHSSIGYNYRLSNILAGIGRAQLEVLDDRVKVRREIFDRYKKSLRNIPGITFMPELKDTMGNRWLTALTIDDKINGVRSIDVINALEAENIESRPVWKPLHLQPVFKDAAFFTESGDKSISSMLFEQGLCLPSGSGMTFEDQERVVEIVKEVLEPSKLAQ